MAGYAQGPAKVPAANEWPPVGWGSCISPWEERVRRWRLRPNKERRNCSEPRQRADPTMKNVTKVYGLGIIAWSNGYGKWTRNYGYSSDHCNKMGYWVRSDDSYGRARYIGATIEDVKIFLDQHADAVRLKAAALISNARKHRAAALESIRRFEEILRTQVLDHIVTALEAS